MKKARYKIEDVTIDSLWIPVKGSMKICDRIHLPGMRVDYKYRCFEDFLLVVSEPFTESGKTQYVYVVLKGVRGVMPVSDLIRGARKIS